MNTYGITAINVTCDIVTTIYIINITSINQQTGSITRRECYTTDGFLFNVVLVRIHVSHTTAAIDIIYLEIRRVKHKEDTFRISHGSLITTTVEVTNQAAF